MHSPAVQPRALPLLRHKQLVAHGIVNDAGDQLAVLSRCQPRLPVLEPQRNAENRKSMREIRCAVQRIHVPAIFDVDPLPHSLLAIDSVVWKRRAQPLRDQLFRCAIRLSHQIDIAFVFGRDATLEIPPRQCAGFQCNPRRAPGQLQVLRNPAVQCRLTHWPSSPARSAVGSLRFPRRPSRPCSVIVRIWCL